MDDQFRVVDVSKFKIPKIPWRAAAAGVAALFVLVGLLGAVSRRYAHKIPFILKFNHNEFISYPNSFARQNRVCTSRSPSSRRCCGSRSSDSSSRNSDSGPPRPACAPSTPA